MPSLIVVLTLETRTVAVHPCLLGIWSMMVAATTVWQEKFDSVTAASPGRSGGMSDGGFFGSKKRVCTSGGTRSMTTDASAALEVDAWARANCASTSTRMNASRR